MTSEQIHEIKGMLTQGFEAVDGTVTPFDEPAVRVVVEFAIPGNDGGFLVRIADNGPKYDHPEFRYTCEAWQVDAKGNRVSEVASGNGGDTPETAMQVSHWRALNRPAGGIVRGQ